VIRRASVDVDMFMIWDAIRGSRHRMSASVAMAVNINAVTTRKKHREFHPRCHIIFVRLTTKCRLHCRRNYNTMI